MDQNRPGLIMCVCTGKCPGFSKMDIWDFINRVRVELPVEYGFIHPQLCEEDGDRFLADMLKSKRKMIVAGCAPNAEEDVPRRLCRRGNGHCIRFGGDRHPRHDHGRNCREDFSGLGWHEGETAVSESTSWACRGKRFPGSRRSTTRSATTAWRRQVCPHQVFERREAEERKLVVANPNNCVVSAAPARSLWSRRDLVPRKAGDRGHD